MENVPRALGSVVPHVLWVRKCPCPSCMCCSFAEVPVKSVILPHVLKQFLNLEICSREQLHCNVTCSQTAKDFYCKFNERFLRRTWFYPGPNNQAGATEKSHIHRALTGCRDELAFLCMPIITTHTLEVFLHSSLPCVSIFLGWDVAGVALR